MADERAQRLADAQSADVALLAVVPHQHLVSGLQTQSASGRVAYGTDNAMLLPELEHELGGQSCCVLIYASEAPYSGAPMARWRAIYSRQTPAKHGRHPEHATYRPSTTDSDGAWLTFWEVIDLEELPTEEALPMSKLRARRRKTNLPADYIPKGPLVIDNPY